MNSEEMEKMLDLELANMKYDPGDDLFNKSSYGIKFSESIDRQKNLGSRKKKFR